MCGRVAEKLEKTSIEDAVLNVCENCASYGRRIFEGKKEWKEKPLEVVSLNPSFASIIKLKREALGLSREELARKINEKLSYLERIENGKTRPEQGTTKKLEKTLKIRLLGYEEK